MATLGLASIRSSAREAGATPARNSVRRWVSAESSWSSRVERAARLPYGTRDPPLRDDDRAGSAARSTRHYRRTVERWRVRYVAGGSATNVSLRYRSNCLLRSEGK